jgi:hypothetical protein
MHKLILSLAASLVLTALLALPASAATRTGSSSGQLVATGTITSPSGAAMVGVQVDLYAWPADAVLSAMKDGQAVPEKLLATATTNSAGDYALMVPQASLTSAVAATGYANLELDAPGGIRFFSYQPASPTQPSAAPAVVNVRTNSKWACGYDSRGRPYSLVPFSLERVRKPAWAVVGQGYILRSPRTRGDWVNFNYTEGSSRSQNSALGVGLSGYGFDAGYNSDGTSQSTAKRAEGFARESGNSWFRTMFNTGQYRGLCIGQANQPVPHQKQHGQCPRKWNTRFYVHKCLWLIHSRGWFGAASALHPRNAPNTPRGHCGYQQAGSHFSGDFGSAVQWSKGFELGAALHVKGVNLKADFNSSAHTGYDANAIMYYKFHQKGYLCGTNRGPANARMLVARASLPSH